MYKGYKNKLKRKLYLREYRKKNREKIYRLREEWVRKHPEKKYHLGGVKDNNKGRKWELVALKLLSGARDNNKKSFAGPFDLTWQGKKIDVKCREQKKDKSWSFGTRKSCKANYYLCFCLTNERAEKILLIPKGRFRKGISVGQKSKWDIYSLSF